MSTTDTPARSRAPWWFNLAGQLLEPWVRIRREPAEPAALLQAGVPVCYVIERDGFSDGLILERACREAGLPSPMQPLSGTRRRRSVFALARRDGWLFGRNRQRSPNEPLGQLVRSLEGDPERDIQIVPVSIYVGRAPTRESGWFSVLFSENWVVVGRFRRMLALLLNGRDTVVHFSTPVSLRTVVNEAGEDVAHSGRGRLAAETVVWAPQALAPQCGATWAAIDERRASVTIDAAGEAVRVEVAVDADGTLTEVGLARWNGSFRPPAYAPFGGTCTSTFTSETGVRIAGSGEVGWGWGTPEADAGRFFRYQITAREIQA